MNKPRRSSAPRARRARKQRRVAKRNEVCKIKETISLTDCKANTAYDATVRIGDFTRALDIADNFQEYRITKVEFKYTPLYDTFIDASGGTGVATVPYLYSSRQLLPPPAAFGLAYLKALGAKPRRLDDKTLIVSYTPNVNAVLNADGNSGSSLTTASPRYKPWISTHVYTTASSMDNTVHLGHQFWLDQAIAPGGVVSQLEVTAHFEFRKPWDKATMTGGGQTLQVAKKE